MQQNKNNPFEVLGLAPEHINKLASLDEKTRTTHLRSLRRFLSFLYHPDRPINADDTSLGKINNALDELQKSDGFFAAHKEYQAITQAARTGESGSLAMKQAAYYRRQAEDTLSEARINLEDAHCLAEEKDEVIRDQNLELRLVQNKYYELEGKYERLRDHSANATSHLGAYRSKLIGDLVGAYTGPVPKGMQTLDQIAGNELYISLGKRLNNTATLDVDSDRDVVRTDDNLRENMMVEKGYLLGGIEASLVLKIMNTVKPYHFELLTRRMSTFDPVLANTKPYLGIGMHPVLLPPASKAKSGPIYLHGELTDIKPLQK